MCTSKVWVTWTRSIGSQNDIPPCSPCCWISWMVLTPQQCRTLQACPHPAPPCLLWLRFLMTKCIETIGCTLPSIHRHSKGSLCGSGPQDFRQLTKQLLFALDWLAAMLFRPTGKKAVQVSRAEWGGMATAIYSPPNALAPHQSKPEVSVSHISIFHHRPLLYCMYFFRFDIGLIYIKSNKVLCGKNGFFVMILIRPINKPNVTENSDIKKGWSNFIGKKKKILLSMLVNH